MGIDTIPTGILNGVSGSLIAAPVVNAVPGNGVLVLAAGVYNLYAVGANITYQVFDGAAWQNITLAGAVAPLIYSDGVNYRFNNAAVGAQNATTIKIG